MATTKKTKAPAKAGKNAKAGAKRPASGGISEAKGKATVKAKNEAALTYAILKAAEGYVTALRMGERAKGALWDSFKPLLEMTKEEGERVLRHKENDTPIGVLDILEAKAEADGADDADKKAARSAKMYASCIRTAWYTGAKLHKGESYDAFYKRATDAKREAQAEEAKRSGKRAPQHRGRKAGDKATGKDVQQANVSKDAIKVVAGLSAAKVRAIGRITKALDGLTGDALERATADAIRAIHAVREQMGVPVLSDKGEARTAAGATVN